MRHGLNRRRFIAVSAAAAGLGLLPFSTPKKSAAAHLVEWRGASLGAVATVRIHHPDRSGAQRLIRQVVGETRRLETVFSLYRQDSSLCELNRHGTRCSFRRTVGPPNSMRLLGA
jgi:thiamine biosynthesis lipoprotein